MYEKEMEQIKKELEHVQMTFNLLALNIKYNAEIAEASKDSTQAIHNLWVYSYSLYQQINNRKDGLNFSPC